MTHGTSPTPQQPSPRTTPLPNWVSEELARRATQASTAWPDGVIARYLTDAGKALSNSDLAVDVHPYRKKGQHTLVKCGVCPWEYDASGNPSMSQHFEDAYCESEANKKAHAAAQAHAERCRALPRPAGA